MQREQKSLNGFKFGTFIGRFLSDGAASVAVKGLKTQELSNTIQYNFIAKCQYTDCTRNVLWCQVHSSHIHSNHKTFNYNRK